MGLIIVLYKFWLNRSLPIIITVSSVKYTFCEYSVYSAELATQVSIGPKECICPSEGYVCQADFVTSLDWTSDTIVPNSLYYSTRSEIDTNTDGKQVKGYKSFLTAKVLLDLVVNLTTEIFITDPLLNGTELRCEGSTIQNSDIDTLTVCITGGHNY